MIAPYRVPVLAVALCLMWVTAMAAGPAAAEDETPTAVAALDRVELLRWRQDYISALDLAVRTLADEVHAAAPDTALIVTILNSIAAFSHESGDHLPAEMALRAAVPLAERHRADRPGLLAETLLWRGRLDRRLWGVPRATPVLADAAALLAELPGHEAVRGRLLQAQANFERRRHGSAVAVPLYEKALAYRRAHLPDPHPDTAENMVWLAWNLNEAGRWDEAQRLLDEAESQYARLDLRDHTLNGTITEMRFDEAALAGDFARCERLARREIAIYESARPDFPFGYGRVGCSLTGYRRLLWTMLQQDRIEGTFEILARQDSPVTQEFHCLQRWLRGDGAPYRTRLRNLYGRVQAVFEAFDAGPQDPETGLRLALDALEAWAGIQDLLRQKSDEIGGLSYGVADVQAALPPRTALISTLDISIGGKNFPDRTIRQQDLWVMVLRRDRPLQWVRANSARGAVLDTNNDDNAATARMLMRAVAWPAHVPPDPELERVLLRKNQRAFANVAPLLDGIETVVSVGMTIPAIVYAGGNMPPTFMMIPAANLFVSLSEAEAAAPPRTETRALVIASAGPAGDLVWPDQEKQVLERLYPDVVALTGEDDIEQSLAELDADGELATFDLVHFAGHAEQVTTAERQALVVGSEARAPQRLEAGELLYGYDFAPELMVLSGCSTVTMFGAVLYEYHGLSQVLLGLGARRVVASLWDVNDEATGLVMQRFYENYSGRYAGTRAGFTATPMSAGRALSEAQHWLRDLRDGDGHRPWGHPIYWSGFALFGLP